ncbi:MAG: NADH-quinone oxidoreductase subunit L [Deltaproteobacteria bacterium]|nr:NADH-quinone oxidoreductase subunit L [Deltaproteobacteria bacterium]
MKESFPLIWIPLLPLLGAAFNLLLGRKLSRRWVHTVAVGTVFGSLVMTLFVLRQLYAGWDSHHHTMVTLHHAVFDWINAGAVQIKFGLMADTLTGVMLFIVTFVGALIHLYSTGYMDHERDYARFFGYLNLFMGAMLLLVLGDNLVVLFLGWEGVGLCSYLLIGFWYDKSGTQKLGLENANAGRKAFIVNRIGDLAFIIGMFILFAAVGSLDFADLSAAAAQGPQGPLMSSYAPFGFGPFSLAGVAALFLFIGATGKSAQIPLYVWLPDAMAGPTPVSALIHAATMVTAGVYMVARMNFLYMLTPSVMAVVALVGALTAFVAATIGLAQNDIKKVLAYSTVSQLGYMFMGVGVGAYAAGIFHVFTHAFFKACLFLGAGAVIHALHHEQDIRRMGGLKSSLSVTRLTFLVATIAIAGIPPLSGFFSKDEILWKAISTANPAAPWLGPVIYVLGMAGAICTAFYMFRLYTLTFEGKCRLSAEEQAKIHPPDWRMATPLVVLAFGALVLGVLGLPGLFGEHANFFHNWLAPTVDQGAKFAALAIPGAHVTPAILSKSHGAEGGLMALSFAIALLGSVIAWRVYNKGPSVWARNLTDRFRGPYNAIYNKYFVDEFYFLVVIWPFKKIAWLLWKVVDALIIDLLCVRGSARIVDLMGRLVRQFQTGSVQHYLAGLLVGVGVILYVVAQPPDDFRIRANSIKAAGAPLKVLVGERVFFDARRPVDKAMRALEYKWDFDGDGKVDEPQAPTQQKGQKEQAQRWSKRQMANFIYKKPGRYRVVMDVRDTRWHTQARETQVIDVIDPNAPKVPVSGSSTHGKGVH